MIDIEALLVNYLLEQQSIVDVVDKRVYTDLPHDRVHPLILVKRNGGGYIYQRHLDTAEIGIEVWGGPHKQAESLTQTVLSLLVPRAIGARPEGVVTKVSTPTITYDPDVDSADAEGHSRPRYTVACNVTSHP